jgi:putative addiction module component (TIGR02574 family)
MSNINFKIPAEFDSAPKAARIEFVQELWDKIASDPEAIAIPEHHRNVLDERLDEFDRNPNLGRPWPEVREQLLAVLRKR